MAKTSAAHWDRVLWVRPQTSGDEAADLDVGPAHGSSEPCFCVRVRAPTGEAAAPTWILALHGAGMSSMSFTALSRSLDSRVGLISFDFRGHGQTRNVLPETDLRTQTLVDDAVGVLKRLVDAPDLFPKEAKSQLFLLGHSLGGCIATRIAELSQTESWSLGIKISGLIVIDAVEGLALAGIEAGRRHFEAQPQTFPNPETAVDWSLTSGPLRNRASAVLSVPDQLITLPGGSVRWRVNLAETAPFWRDWFTGISGAFVAFRGPKLLMLAGAEKLDQTLMIAQMQGKFQVSVFSTVTAGHFLMEDSPVQAGNVISAFCNRYRALGT